MYYLTRTSSRDMEERLMLAWWGGQGVGTRTIRGDILALLLRPVALYLTIALLGTPLAKQGGYRICRTCDDNVEQWIEDTEPSARDSPSRAFPARSAPGHASPIRRVPHLPCGVEPTAGYNALITWDLRKSSLTGNFFTNCSRQL